MSAWRVGQVFVAGILLAGCGGGGGGGTASDGGTNSYAVTYDGNGSTGGSVPGDAKRYAAGDTVQVLDNTGSLVRKGHSFTGWNTQADGGGTGYVAGDSFLMGPANVTLYGAWSANPTHVVISQIYAGGGMIGATYAKDFVELYNPTNVSVDLTNWSVQYASVNSAFGGTKVLIPAGSVISAGGHFLIMLGGGSIGNPLPAADLTDAAVGLPPAGGKLALVDGTGGTLTCGDAANRCSSASIADLVGWGGASDYEGTGPATYPADATQSILRQNGGCLDSGNNDTDFNAGAVTPLNSAAAASACP